jgi:uncharacterized membrane protein YjjB (DUF3815 family)
MIPDWIDIIFKAFWCGCAAMGFAILFNTPPRALFAIFLCGSLAGFFKFTLLLPDVGGGIILASAAGAAAIGFASIPVSHWRHIPPAVVSIPAVIPLIPGYYAYQTMLGLISFINQTDAALLISTAFNAAMTFFIILGISLGVTLPMLLFRIESVKKVNYSFPNWRKRK